MASTAPDTRTIDQEALYRRTLRVVLISQILGGAGLAAGVTVGALLAEDLLGSSGYSGLPAALFTLGSAGAALLVGRISQASGRRIGLAYGYAGGAIGGAGVVLAAVIENVPLLFLALLIYGSGTATNLQARYAGADLATPGQRGRSTSTILFATTFGAVAGPNLTDPMGSLAQSWGIPELAGPFILASAAYALAGIVLFVLLRPDPLLTAKSLAGPTPPTTPGSMTRPAEGFSLARLFSTGVGLGATVMVLTQMVMIAIMSMTPIHMRDHGHSLGATGLVIAIHIGAMYLPSPVTGLLIDRLGRVPIVAASAVTLLAAGLLAAVAPPDSVVVLAVALALLGLGWNFGLLSGTAIVTDATPLETRASTQGAVDLCVALAGASGGLISGLTLAATSYGTLATLGGLLALAIIPIIVVNTRSTPTATGPGVAGKGGLGQP